MAEIPSRASAVTPGMSRWMLVLFVLALLLAWVGFNLQASARGGATEITDGHFTRSANFHAFLESGEPRLLMRYGDPSLQEHPLDLEHGPVHPPYPPLVYAGSALFYELLGVSLESARLSLLPFGVVLLLSLYGIGCELGGRATGLAALLLGALSPQILFFSQTYVLELPLSAALSLSLYLILRSGYFKDQTFSLLFGFAFGLACLTKWVVLAYLAAPLLLVALWVLSRSVRAFLLGLGGLPFLLVVAFGLWHAAGQGTKPSTWTLDGSWLWSYLLLGLAPCAGLALYAVLAGRRLERAAAAGSAEGPLLRASMHLLLALAVAGAVALPWYFWGLGDLLLHSRFTSTHYDRQELMPVLWGIFRYQEQAFPFAWLLMGLGLGALFFGPRHRPARLVALLSLGFWSIMTFQTGKPENLVLGHVQSRLLLPTLVFAIPLAAGSLDTLGELWSRTVGLCRAHGPLRSPRFARVPGLVAVLLLSLWFSRHRLQLPERPRAQELPAQVAEVVSRLDPEDSSHEQLLVLDPEGLLRISFEQVYVATLVRTGKMITAYDLGNPGPEQPLPSLELIAGSAGLLALARSEQAALTALDRVRALHPQELESAGIVREVPGLCAIRLKVRAGSGP